MAPTATGSKARLALQARHKACMGWSWAAACGVQGRGHIVAASLLTNIVKTLFNVTALNYVNRNLELFHNTSCCYFDHLS